MKPFEVKPMMGGRLLSGLSAESAGLFNYTIKRDWRRKEDREVRSEGFDLFDPNPLNLASPMPDAGGEPILLATEVQSPNGRRAFVVGTRTQLWYYSGVENGGYFAQDYCSQDYVVAGLGDWTEIGSGFSRAGRRWEAEAIAGYLVLNNAVDLPVSYQVGAAEVVPLYELREQGIASVGTIGKFSNVLVCGDIKQVKADYHKETLMAAIPAAVDATVVGITRAAGLATVNSGVAGVAGNTLLVTSGALNSTWEGQEIRMANGLTRTIFAVLGAYTATLSGAAELAEPEQPFYLPGATDNRVTPEALTLFPSLSAAGAASVIGRKLFWDTGETREITGVDSGFFLVDSDQPVPSGPLDLENSAAYAAFTDAAHIDHFQWRLIESMPGEPRRFAAVVPATARAGSRLLELAYPVKSLEAGQTVTITDAGQNGEPLRTTILWAYPGVARELMLEDEALPGVLEAVLAVRAATTAAQLTADSTHDTLVVQQIALAAANAALALSPDDVDLKQAVADASAKVDAARETASAAAAALLAAEAAQVVAEAVPTSTDEALLTRTDAVGSLVGYDDLEGDGSGILRIISLNGYLVVAKETSFFLGRFTGRAGSPFDFVEIPVATATALKHRHTLVKVSDRHLLYAGASNFYQFDLVTRLPKEFDLLQTARDLFFDNLAIVSSEPLAYTTRTTYTFHVSKTFAKWSDLDPLRSYELELEGKVKVISSVIEHEILVGSTAVAFSESGSPESNTWAASSYSLREVGATEDMVFAAENAITKEIWFCFPSSGEDKALRLNYENGTVSTSSLALTAAATVRRPASQVLVGASVDWFALGFDDGTVGRYGLTLEPALPSGVITATASGQVVTSSAAFFRPTMVGKSLLFPSGHCAAIISYTDPQHVTVLGNLASLTAQVFRVLPAIWHRNTASYDSVLQSGLDSLGNPNGEQQWTEYVPVLSSRDSSRAALTLAFRGGVNPSAGADIFTTTLNLPLTENLVTLILREHYLGDRVTVAGQNNPCELTARLFTVAKVNSHSFSRRKA